MKIKRIDYGRGMDVEMQTLCDTLNALPGIHTIESCGGHGKQPPIVFFYCTSLKSLAKIQRAIDWRYGGLITHWSLKGTTTDTARYNTSLLFYIEADAPYRAKKKHKYEAAFYHDVNLIIENIKLYCTKWGDAICRGITDNKCPTSLWRKFTAICDRLRNDFEAAENKEKRKCQSRIGNHKQ